jgi:elongator complex protein 6
MQLRGLDTGVAKDVSGVLRVSRVGGWEDLEGKAEMKEDGTEDVEWLYQIKGDGSVRVWLRGE